jgi:hypothetical protein
MTRTAVTQFLQSTYEAAAEFGGQDRTTLEDEPNRYQGTVVVSVSRLVRTRNTACLRRTLTACDTPSMVVAAGMRLLAPSAAQTARMPSPRKQVGTRTWAEAYNDLHSKRQFGKR